MQKSRIGMSLGILGVVLLGAPARGEGPAFASVADLLGAHDRAILRDLTAYLNDHPRAEDLDQAYLTLFNKAIEHDWFADHAAVADRYLASYPDGAVRPLAQIVATMARAQAGQFDAALARFKELMNGLGKPEQEEFAANFADTLAGSATAAGAYTVARQVYETLLARYDQSPTLRQKIRADLARLDMVGKPAPNVVARDIQGGTVRLADLRGKYVLIDFWATWCAPCVAELPRLQAAYTRYHEAGFEIVGVSLDESKSAVVDFARSRKTPWRQIHNAGAGADLVEAFGVNTIPATFLIDPQGIITRLELRGPVLDQALAKLFKDPAVARQPPRPVR
jgi:peroxiredoxin